MNRLPPITQGARGGAGAFRIASGALVESAEAIDCFHDVDEFQFLGRNLEAETTGRALARFKQSLSRKLLKDLRKEVRRYLFFRGDVLHHGELPFGEPGEVYKGADCIFGGL